MEGLKCQAVVIAWVACENVQGIDELRHAHGGAKPPTKTTKGFVGDAIHWCEDQVPIDRYIAN